MMVVVMTVMMTMMTIDALSPVNHSSGDGESRSDINSNC